MAKISGAFPVRWKPQDGAPGEGVTISQHITRYAVGANGTDKPTSGWSTSIPTADNGLYLWTWVYMKYSDGTETNAYSVSRMGIDGKGIKSSVVTYSQQETNVSPEKISNWGAFPETLQDGYWLYTRTVITYTEGTEATPSYSVSQVGVGSYYAGTEEYYALSASRTEVPAGHPADGDAAIFGKDAAINITGDWSQERPAADADKPYIWNFSISHDSRDNSYVTKAICIGNFAKGIVSIVESYAISAQGTVPSGKQYPSDIADNEWTDEVHAAAPTEEKPYQWNRTVTTYNDNSQETHYHVSAVKGADGRGSVYIDLDNENDTMLYDGAGNLVGESDEEKYVTSNIVLYENGVKAASQPTFSVKEKGTGVTASISGSVLTVKGCTTASGYVIVGCTYNGTEYTARFTVKRLVGVDKYEISLDHNAVIHNTDTDVLSVKVITATVYRTGQNGAREVVAALTSYGLTMEYWPNGLSANKKSITDYSSGASITIDSDWESVDVVLMKGGVVVDRESVPIGKVKNGPKGEGAMRLDLDNENDTMLYAMSGSTETLKSGAVISNATLYQGAEIIEASEVGWSVTTTNCTASISAAGIVTVTGMTNGAVKASVLVNASYGGKVYTATLSLKKLRDEIKYSLACTPNAVSYNSDDGSLSASTVEIRVYRTDLDGTKANVSYLSTYSLTLETSAELTRSYSAGYATVKVDPSQDSITVTLKRGTTVLDTETIIIAKTRNGAATQNNLLDNTDFERLDAWKTKVGNAWIGANGSVEGEQIDGIGAYHAEREYDSDPTYSYHDVLVQIRTNILLPSTWYTLSFFCKGTANLRTYLYPSVADASVKAIVDGVETTIAADTNVGWSVEDSYTFHYVTFKTASSISGAKNVLFRLIDDSSISLQSIYICMPKLERSEVPTPWCRSEADKKGETGAAGPTGPAYILQGAWNATRKYTKTAKVVPVVLDETDNNLYALNAASSQGIQPSTATDGSWEAFDYFEYVFTKVLFAKFGQLAAAVFYENYMFSQFGINNSNKLARYSEDMFDDNGKLSGYFMPNFFVDLLNGEVKCNRLSEPFVKMNSPAKKIALNESHNVCVEAGSNYANALPSILFLPNPADIVKYDGTVLADAPFMFDGTNVCVLCQSNNAIQNAKQYITWGGSGNYDIRRFLTVLCADGRIGDYRSYRVHENGTVGFFPDKGFTSGGVVNRYEDTPDGLFYVNGHFTKFLLLAPGDMVRLKSCYIPYTYNDGRVAGNILAWFVDNANNFDNTPIKLTMSIENYYDDEYGLDVDSNEDVTFDCSGTGDSFYGAHTCYGSKTVVDKKGSGALELNFYMGGKAKDDDVSCIEAVNI